MTTPPGIGLLVALIFTLFNNSAQAAEKYKVAILMFDEVQIIDFAAPYEVFGQAKFEVFTVSKDGKPVTTAMGLDVSPKYSFANMPKADAILVPGGDVRNAMADTNIRQWLHTQQATAEYILSVCTGSHILATAGLLDNQAATTFHRAIPGFTTDFPNITVQPEKRFVDNGQVITSAGLSSGIDASLHLVSKVLGLEKAKTIAMHIEYDWDPNGGFVRAVMADRMFPENDYDWPEGIVFDRLSSFGDQNGWQASYKVTTQAGIDDVVGAYHAAMRRHDDWLTISNTEPNFSAWNGIGENAHWQHQLHVTQAAQPDQYVLRIEVQRMD